MTNSNKKYSSEFSSMFVKVLASMCEKRDIAEAAIKAAREVEQPQVETARVSVTTESVASVMTKLWGSEVTPSEVAVAITSGEVPGYGFVKGPYGGIWPADRIAASIAAKSTSEADKAAAKEAREADKAAKAAIKAANDKAAKEAKKATKAAEKAAAKAEVKPVKVVVDTDALAALIAPGKVLTLKD